MTARSSRSALGAAATLAVFVAGCAQTVVGTAVGTVQVLEGTPNPSLDVGTVLLDQAQLRAITGAEEELTAVPGMQGDVPVDIDFMPESIPQQCQWVFAETQVFGPDLQEFHKTTYQNPRDGGLISQAVAGYRDHRSARAAFDSLVARIHGCDQSRSGRGLVGEVNDSADSVHIRPGDCGRDYRIKSVVLVEVTFCAFPAAAPDVVMTNILANVPG